ncbi:hypothetical protein RCL1_000488 [Eukaryota sp. TZLM3-RCL]
MKLSLKCLLTNVLLISIIATIFYAVPSLITKQAVPKDFDELQTICESGNHRILSRSLGVKPWTQHPRFRFPLDSVPIMTSSYNPTNTSLTVCTFFTLCRLERFLAQIKAFDGPISAVVLARSTRDVCNALSTISSAKYPHVTLDIVWGYSDILPINSIRNYVISNIKTSHYLWLDVDFIPSLGLSEVTLPREREAIIIPAFEQTEQFQNETIPPTKEQLLVSLDLGHIGPFDQNLTVAHNLTRFDVWKNTKAQYETKFEDYRNEPYLVVQRGSTPPFDERFPYGYRNKMQHSSHINILGFKLFVNPDHFVVHMWHPPTKESRTLILFEQFNLSWDKLHKFHDKWEQQARKGLLHNSFDDYLKK